MDRRTFFRSTAAVLAAPALLPASVLQATAKPFVETGPTIEIETGKVRGFRKGEVHVFRGIPYAGALKPEHRFAEAPVPEPWSGVRSAYGYGPVCPSEERLSDDSTIEWPFLIQRGPITIAQEDCLRINIWTGGLNDGRRRPVMLWLHPQGFGGGSSQHFLANDGENLARNEDVVVASINHRVGLLGYADLSQVPGADENSGNVGMLDIVAALRWIKRNIEAFGGDPDNVTIFGQSGGAFKVSVLMAMPAAEGLFHKAIIMSGARPRVHSRETGAALTAALLKTLDMPNADIAALRALPIDRLIAAGRDAGRAVASVSAPPPAYSPPPWFWQPVAGVPSLPEQPFDPKAPRFSANVPLIVGNTLHEFPRSVDAPQLEKMSWEEAGVALHKELGDRAAAVLAGSQEDHKGIKPIEAIAIASGRHFRMGAVRVATLRAKSGAAPSWNYIFQWQTPLLEGRPRAFHGLDVPFVFANSDLCDQATGGGARPRALAAVMASAWARFARTGNPNGGKLPLWPVFTPEKPAAMLFDDDSRVTSDPDPAFRKALMAS
ncbi:carboxylesterase/lipase family protein [Sphingorhabdus contaminans]|uniref:carboxylesterase/lipase family protein n=1 Tax=Sphingorhabdus contaminans TaxID=1343899 RepID=UPI003D26C940